MNDRLDHPETIVTADGAKMTSWVKPFDQGRTAQDALNDNLEPTVFWVNPLGEYGHKWSDGSETVGGSINLREAMESAGLRWEPPYEVPKHIEERAFARAVAAEIVEPIEHVLYRAYNHLDLLASSCWRFFVSLGYEGDRKPIDPVLGMSIEYVVTKEQQDKLAYFARLMLDNEPDIHVMWNDYDDSSKTQVSVEFNVLGKGFGEVAGLQVEWLMQAAELTGDLVHVL